MLLIKNGTLIDPATNTEGEFDLLIEGGVIKDTGPRGSFSAVKAQRVIDAAGRWVVPGFIDLHVHFREPGYEWKETVATGAAAAALGGFTSVCCMPNTNPVNDHAEITEFIIKQARAAGLARVHPIGAVTLSSRGESLAHLEDQVHAGAVAFSDDGEPVHNAGIMRRALEWCLRHGVPVSCHEEDKTLTQGFSMNESALSHRLGLKGFPTVAEDIMIARDLELALYTGGKVHICHVSTARGVELIRRAKNEGIQVTAEATLHHMHLTEEAVGDYDTAAKMSPPLRSEKDRRGVLQGVKEGVIDAIASDHAPHEHDSKRVEFAKASLGLIGLQTNIPLLMDLVQRGELSRRRAVEAFTTGPARAFGLAYGTLKKGAAADVSIIDPAYRWNYRREVIVSKSWNTPFLGRDMCGIAETVIVGGNVVVEKQKLTGSKS